MKIEEKTKQQGMTMVVIKKEQQEEEDGRHGLNRGGLEIYDGGNCW